MQQSSRRVERSLARLALATFMALAASAIVGQSTAHAQTLADPDYYKQTVERHDTVYRFIYDQSPQAIPADYDPVLEAEEILRQQVRAAPASNPETSALLGEIEGTEAGVGLAPELSALGTIGLAVGTFEIGWKIGTGINAKFLKIGVPEATDDLESYRWYEMRWTQARSREYFGTRWPAQDGWVPWMRQMCCTGAQLDRWFSEPCTFTGFSPPAPFVTLSEPNATVGCSVLYGWAPEEALRPTGPIETYTDQPYNKTSPAPTPPPQSTAEQAIDDQLDDPENAKLRQWLNYQLGSPGEDDPITGAVNMPDCAGETPDACTATLANLGITDYQVQTLPESNLSFADGEVVTTDPEPGTSVDPATTTITIAANPATRVGSKEDTRCDRDTYGAPGDPGPAPSDGTPYPQLQTAPVPWDGPYSAVDPGTTPWQPVSLVMRYGLQPTNPEKGWGWRHIKAKHGYGATEMNETAQALVTDPAPTLMFASTRQYAFHLYYEMPDDAGTIWCVRTALVELKPDKLQLRLGDDSPKGVINSYTGLLLGAETP